MNINQIAKKRNDFPWLFFLLLSSIFLSCSSSGNVRKKQNMVAELDGSYILIDSLGRTVTSVLEWEERKKEIFNFFADNIYGRIPQETVDVSYNIYDMIEKDLDGKATFKKVDIVLKKDTVTRKIGIELWIPNVRCNNKQHAPMFLGLDLMPVEKIIDQNYGVVSISLKGFYPDDAMGVKMKNRQGESILALWGIRNDVDMHSNGGQMIAAYAWGISKVVDYLEKDVDVDASELILTGCSRGGKIAVWSAVTEPRIALVAISQSGGMGAALTNYHGTNEEPLSHLGEMFPHWFCPNFYTNYMKEENHVTYDQDALLALIAPRPLYVCSSVEYKWGDPIGEFLAVRNIGRVYELYGYKGLDTPDSPAINTPVMNRVGYHNRIGAHNISDYDWEQFFIFASMWLRNNQ